MLSKVSKISLSILLSLGLTNLEGKRAFGVCKSKERRGSDFTHCFDLVDGPPFVTGLVGVESNSSGTGTASDGSSLPLLIVMTLTFSRGFASGCEGSFPAYLSNYLSKGQVEKSESSGGPRCSLYPP